MVARIVKIGIVGLLAAALLGGSAYVLLRPGEVQAERGERQEQINNSSSGGGKGPGQGVTGNSGNPDRGGQGGGYGTAEKTGSGKRGGNGQGSGGKGDSSGTGTGYAESQWVTVAGEVLALNDDELSVETIDGNVVMHLGPEWYWESEGIELTPGDAVTIDGFYEGDEFKVSRIENATIGESVSLRDESGRPLWAGGGRKDH